MTTATSISTSTPSRRSLAHPRASLGHSSKITASSPSLASAFTSSPRPPLPTSHPSGRRPSTNRKASLSKAQAKGLIIASDGSTAYPVNPESGSSPLTMYPSRPANSRTATDDKYANQNLEVGDIVDVPGSMHGVIKFIGEVKGKKGHFAGVELSKEFAAKGKNDGDVDGCGIRSSLYKRKRAKSKSSIRYFTTSIRGAGIFLPSNKAYKRHSPSFSSDSMPATPDTPNLGSAYLGSRGEPKVYTPTTSSSTSKFSQSVGPGRARSPDFKPKSRPSLPRPESPVRKAQNTIPNSTVRPSAGAPKLSKSVIGGPRYAQSPTPGKFGSSMRGPMNGDPGKPAINFNKPTPKTPVSAKSQVRSDSRLGPEPLFDSESGDTPTGLAKALPSHNERQKLGLGSTTDDEVRHLRLLLETRDQQIQKQTVDLEEMQTNIAELQAVTPKHNSSGTMRSRGSGVDELDAPTLRALVREKNEKIATLTSDFDAHRAQFRNTIDSLERTSDETNRIYEQQVDGLKQEIRELQDRGDDVESVAQQLKQLEELVQELEEGLEDARRGEAEARGEVEFLRGEVERTRSELKREKDKAAAALRGVGVSMDGNFSSSGSSREVEQRDDEIRGLKAIIHSLSRDAVPDGSSPKYGSRRGSKLQNAQANGHPDNLLIEERQAREQLEREVKELEGLVDRKTYREEELEHEIERLRKSTAHVSASSNGVSERTTMPSSNHRPNPSKTSSTEWREQVSPMKRRGGNLDAMAECDSHSTMTDNSTLYCEMCETLGHEIFTCPKMNGDQTQQGESRNHATPRANGGDIGRERTSGLAVSSPHQNNYPPSLSPAKSPTPQTTGKAPNPMDPGPAPGKATGTIDMEKWCALCEKDGHESVDCPFEEMY